MNYNTKMRWNQMRHYVFKIMGKGKNAYSVYVAEKFLLMNLGI